jgi:hypothetical protein
VGWAILNEAVDREVGVPVLDSLVPKCGGHRELLLKEED